MTRSTPEQRQASLFHSILRGLRAAVWQAPEDVKDRHRTELPSLWGRIDDAVEALGDPMQAAEPLVNPPEESAPDHGSP
jgi:hypothetical protein